MASSKEILYRNVGGGVLLTHNEADLRLLSNQLVEPLGVHFEKVEEDVSYTTVCLDNASTLTFFDQAQKLFSAACIQSKDCPLSFSTLGLSCNRLKKGGRAVIKSASKIVKRSTDTYYKPKLSEDAIIKLRSIEKHALAQRYHEVSPDETNLFLKTYGSHCMIGPVDKTSPFFQWVVIAEENCDAKILLKLAEEVFATCERRSHEFAASKSGEFYDISGLIDTSKWSKRKEKKLVKSSKLRVMHSMETELKLTFQEWLHMISKTEMDQIQCTLTKSETVIPIWTLIQEDYRQFQDEQLLANFFKSTWHKLVDGTEHLEEQTNGSTTDAVDSRTTWEALLKDIGMEASFPCKLSLRDVMALHYPSSKPSSWNDIAMDLLRRLIMVDNRCMEKPFLDYIDEKQKTTAKETIVYPHPMDVMLLVFHSSDFELRQVIAKKLFMCRKAIPFIIPSETNEIQIMLWPLRSIIMEWKQSDKAMEESLTNYAIPRASFFKFGKSSFSKSNLLNDILSESRHRVFLTRESSLVEAGRIISNGVVEMTHYCPAGKSDDIFSRPMLHFNLRGDACNFPIQADILSRLSNVVVVICDIKEISGTTVQDGLKSMRNALMVVLLTNMTNLGDTLDDMLDEADDFLAKVVKEGYKVIHAFNDAGKPSKQSQIMCDVQTAINESSTQFPLQSLDNSIYALSHRHIIDEETNKNCSRGRTLALKLMTELVRVPHENLKETLFPLQGKVCKEMGSMLRRQYREKHKELKEKVTVQLATLRNHQNIKLSSITSFVMKHFLEQRMDDCTKLFFTQWVKLLLDNECREHLPSLKADYDSKWNELNLAKKKSDPYEIENAQKACNSAEENVSAAGLGLEHLMRELGQIYEVGCNIKDAKALPQMACSLLMAGYPLEIMDGDNGFIPTKWVAAVLKEVSVMVGMDKKIFVLSVLGVQSSGKSTLLNSMFGLEFAVSAGRCTRGIYAQMLPVNKQRSPQLPFDFLLILDSEGLRAPELALQKFEHDNELATLVIGLADLTFINLKGENSAEIQDVLQIVVQAFLRMQRAESYKKGHCMFIHQNVSAVNAEAKMKHGQQKLQESLDAMTIQAAEAHGLEERFTSFHDVISFEGETDTIFCSDLWNGYPPMATVSTDYSEKCALIKNQILCRITQNKCCCITVNDFIIRLQDMWKGVLTDDFVFSFRNTLAAKGYISLEQECAKRRRQIESAMLGWINKECHIQIGNCNTVDELQLCFQAMSTQLQLLPAQHRTSHTDHIKLFVEQHPHRDILEQWKENMLITFKLAIEVDTAHQQKMLVDMKERKMVVLAQQAQQHHHEQEIVENAIGLAEQIRGERPSDEELRDRFETMWTIWSANIRPHETEKGPTILSILLEILTDMFGDWGKLYLTEEMNKHVARSTFTLTKDYVELKNKSWFKKLGQWWKKKYYMEECNTIMKNIIANRHVVDDIASQGLQFNKSHGNKLFQSIFDKFEEINSRQGEGAIFTFKPSAKAKVCLIVCDYAAERFEEMDEEFERLHGVAAHMEAYKKKIFIMFKDTVKHRATEKNAASYLCTAIRPNIEEIVNKDMSRKVVDLICQDIGHVKFHLILRIMDTFTENSEVFPSVQSYIYNSHTYARQWIQNHAESNLLFQRSIGKKNYSEIAASHVTKIIDCIRESVTRASEGNEMNLCGWITSFCENSQQEVSITPNDLKALNNYEITNFETFGRLLGITLSELSTEINEKLAKITKDNVRWDGHNPYTEATTKLWGCKEQCPFCHEPCQRADSNHEANHVCVQHRPSGIIGSHKISSKILRIDTCNTDVASNGTFIFLHQVTGQNDGSYRYKEYKKLYPQWDIAPDDAGDAAQYWKWLICTFEKQIQEWHSHCKLQIPESWRNVTKQQAIDSLRVYKP